MILVMGYVHYKYVIIKNYSGVIMKKSIVAFILSLIIPTLSYATLTVGNVPVTKTGGSTPVIQNSDITDINGNVGIGSTNPGVALDVQGTIRSASSFIFPDGTIQNTSGGLPGSGKAWFDCVAIANSDGSICSNQGNVTTTGSINSSSKSLSVGSASGWSVGMGIAVAQAGNSGGTAELITYITAINGTTFTLNVSSSNSGNLSGVTINHDESRSIQDALTYAQANNLNLYLRGGTYNITSELDITTNGIFIRGDGNRGRNIANGETLTTMGTLIQNRGKTNNIFNTSIGDVKYFDFSIEQALGITPTAGWAFIFGATKMLNVGVQNVFVYKIFHGIEITGGVSGSYFTNIWLYTYGGSGNDACILINNATPFGGLDWTNVECQAANAGGIGWHIIAADTNGYINIGGLGFDNELKIDDNSGASVVQDQRFIGPSFENGSANNANVLITATNLNSVYGISFTGGEIGVNTNSNANGLQISGKANDIVFANVQFHSLNRGVLLGTTGTGISFVNTHFDAITGADFSLNGTNGVTMVGTICDKEAFCTFNSGAPIANVIDMNVSNNQTNVGIGTFNAPAVFDVQGTVGPLAIFGGIGNVGIGSTNPGQMLDVQGTLRMTGIGHISSSGGAPTVANNDCGSTTQGTIVAKSTDIAGTVTVGTLTVTSCSITFNKVWNSAPVCVANDDTNVLAIKPTETTTGITFTSLSSASGDNISWICIGNE
jgi:hypothetical protein